MPDLVTIPRATLKRLQIIHTQYCCNFESVGGSAARIQRIHPEFAEDGQAICLALGETGVYSYPVPPIDWKAVPDNRVRQTH